MLKEHRRNIEADLDEFDEFFHDQLQVNLTEDLNFGPLVEMPAFREQPCESETCSSPDSTDSRIVNRRAIRTTLPYLVSDILSLVLCGIIAHAVLWFFYPDAAAHMRSISPVALLPLIAVYAMGGLYSEIWVHPIIELRHLSHINTIALIAAAAGGMMAPPFPLWCAAAWIAVICFVPLCRSITRHVCAGRRWWGYPTLIIGSGPGIDAVARALLNAPRSGLRPILLTDPDDHSRVSVMPVVNDSATLESLIRAEGIRHAVVSLPEFSNARMSDLLDRFAGIVPHILVLSDASTIPTLWGASRRCGRLTGIEVRNGLLLVTLGFVKRVLDVTISLIVLLAGLPLLILLAMLVKLTSPGPVFFGHTRIGQHGKRFKAWKFRSMYTNADAVLRQHLANVATAQEEWDRDHKLRRDPRVTCIGNLFRKTSLDELPQIWNVLKGDMSLVGPRPIVEKEIVRYGRVFRLYTSVKPGITGLWQVSGRNDIGYDERVELDQFYVRHWSPWLDVYILARTVITLIRRDGAY